jgi:hypothetical protein
MLTASEIYKGLPDATASQRHELIMSKLLPRQVYAPGTGPKALLWGTRFEPIAKDIYEELQFNIEIVDTTCIPHPTVDFLGASPDGIILLKDTSDPRHGRLIEFKCPISREFTEQTPVPPGYFHQMQLQMECTGIDECEYVEMQFKELSYTEFVDCKAPFKSMFAISETDKIIYKDYSDTRTVAEWKDQVLPKDGGTWKFCYWMLNNWRMVMVKHQPNWLSLHLPSLTSVWNEVLEYRRTGAFPQSPKEKTTLIL